MSPLLAYLAGVLTVLLIVTAYYTRSVFQVHWLTFRGRRWLQPAGHRHADGPHPVERRHRDPPPRRPAPPAHPPMTAAVEVVHGFRAFTICPKCLADLLAETYLPAHDQLRVRCLTCGHYWYTCCADAEAGP